MNFQNLVEQFKSQDGVAESTMMGSMCLRYQGEFVTMFFDKEESLIIKVSPERVLELIEDGRGNEFNYTGKRFKEWVLIPLDYEEHYAAFIVEAIEYAKFKLAAK